MSLTFSPLMTLTLELSKLTLDMRGPNDYLEMSQNLKGLFIKIRSEFSKSIDIAFPNASFFEDFIIDRRDDKSRHVFSAIDSLETMRFSDFISLSYPLLIEGSDNRDQPCIDTVENFRKKIIKMPCKKSDSKPDSQLDSKLESETKLVLLSIEVLSGCNLLESYMDRLAKQLKMVKEALSPEDLEAWLKSDYQVVVATIEQLILKLRVYDYQYLFIEPKTLEGFDMMDEKSDIRTAEGSETKSAQEKFEILETSETLEKSEASGSYDLFSPLWALLSKLYSLSSYIGIGFSSEEPTKSSQSMTQSPGSPRSRG